MKYSRQRELIMETVERNPIHPTADSVYHMLKKDYPSLSLGTVYRNLKQLSDYGLIRKITMPVAGDRFDANTKDHCHILCKKCGQVTDVHWNIGKYCKEVEELSKCSIDGYDILFTGLCADCADKHE